MRLLLLPALLAINLCAAAAESEPLVDIDTSLGLIRVELAADKAPETVSNFLAYVDDGFYDNTVFHRVIANFMIQGGGFNQQYQQKQTRPPIANEADNGLRNTRGSIAMARTNDPHSATAQFFINTVDNRALDHQHKSASGWGYTVFGRVAQGMDVVDRIAATRTQRAALNGYPAQDVPEVPIVIKSIRRVTADAGKASVTEEPAAADETDAADSANSATGPDNASSKTHPDAAAEAH